MKFDLNNKTNRFAKRTLAAFSSTMMGILETKPFEKITVNEICETCNYPRATFYNYFDDSYDLLNYCWMVMMQEIMADDAAEAEPKERLYTIFNRLYDYFDTHRKRLERIAAVNPPDGAMIISCTLFVKQQTVKLMMNCPCLSRYPVPYQLAAEHYSNTIQLVIEWSFLRGQLHSRQEAEACLRYLLANV